MHFTQFYAEKEKRNKITELSCSLVLPICFDMKKGKKTDLTDLPLPGTGNFV